MIDRFTAKAREAIRLAVEAAEELGHGYVCLLYTSTEQMLPIIDKMDKVGYHAVECWGGATFDASLRFLKEDPWERLRKLRAGFKNTCLLYTSRCV